MMEPDEFTSQQLLKVLYDVINAEFNNAKECCNVMHKESGYACTRAIHGNKNHVALGYDEIVAVWDDEDDQDTTVD